MSIIRTIKIKYQDAVWVLIPYSVVAVILVIMYRIELFTLSSRVYSTIFFFSLPRFILFSIAGDSLLLMNLILVMFLIIQTMDTEKRRTHYLLASLLTVTGLLLQLSINFFRVYERSFHSAFINDEAASGLQEFIHSSIAELHWSFFIKMAAISVSIFLISHFMHKYYDRIFIILLGSKDKSFAEKLVRWFPPLIVLLLFIAFTTHSVDFRRYSPKEINSLYYAGIMSDLTSNPLVNLIPEKGYAGGLFDQESGDASWEPGTRFNTASVESNERYPEIKLIPRGKRYNIILYFFESTAYQYLQRKVADRSLMPTWNRLMKNSFIAENHYANYPLSANALLNVLGSVYGKFDKGNVIQDHPDIRIHTLSQILHKYGYRTMLMHTGELGYSGQRKFLKHRDFDAIIDMMKLQFYEPYNQQVGWGLDERVMTTPAVQFIEKDPKKPFFMVFMPMNPHHPYAIPDETFDFTKELAEENEKMAGWYTYCNSLNFADLALGEIIDTLEKRGHLEDTLVFLVADHGEAFYQHVMNYNHPFFLYEENVHVPFIIYNKKIFKNPYSYKGISRHIDIAPSILDLLGFGEGKEMEGISIFSPHHEQMALLHTFWKDEFMGIRDRTWKYIVRMEDSYEELYDLSNDPLERKNVAQENETVTGKYRSIVKKARSYNLRHYNHLLSRKK